MNLTGCHSVEEKALDVSADKIGQIAEAEIEVII